MHTQKEQEEIPKPFFVVSLSKKVFIYFVCMLLLLFLAFISQLSAENKENGLAFDVWRMRLKPNEESISKIPVVYVSFRTYYENKADIAILEKLCYKEEQFISSSDVILNYETRTYKMTNFYFYNKYLKGMEKDDPYFKDFLAKREEWHTIEKNSDIEKIYQSLMHCLRELDEPNLNNFLKLAYEDGVISIDDLEAIKNNRQKKALSPSIYKLFSLIAEAKAIPEYPNVFFTMPQSPNFFFTAYGVK
jgi:hypothetical protein